MSKLSILSKTILFFLILSCQQDSFVLSQNVNSIIAYPGIAPCPNNSNGSECPKDIVLFVPTTQEQHTINVGFITPDSLAWSANQDAIVFESKGNVYVYDVKKVLLSKLISTNRLYSTVRWSPNGDKIAFEAAEPSKEFNLFIINADGSHEQQITENLNVQYAPFWSSDEQSLVFTAQKIGQSSHDIYYYNIDDKVTKNLTPDNANDFVSDWINKTDSVLFISDRNQESQIYTINIKNGNIQQLTHDKFHKSRVRWVLDGEYIAYWITDDNNVDTLYLTDTRILNSKTIVSEKGKVTSFDVSSDRTQLAYIVQNKDSEEAHICTINLTITEKVCFPETTPFFNGKIVWGSNS